MSLTSQLITDVFPDLEKVEQLNKEAFPEEERVSLEEFLSYQDRDDAHFFAFYNEEEFVGFAFAISNQKLSTLASLPLCPISVAMATGEKSLKNSLIFISVL